MKRSLLLISLALLLVVGLSAESFTGTWDIEYCWGCGATEYQSATITFTGTTYGTFTCGTYTGSWHSSDGCQITFEFENGTTYSGTKVGKSMQGMMNTVGTSRGCWYAIKRVAYPAVSILNIAGQNGGSIGETGK